MKLRIKGNSIRLRLTQSELADFAQTGRVEEVLTFPGGRRFVYALEASSDVNALAARFEDDRLTVRLPQPSARRWTQSELVGVEETVRLGDGDDLAILVEKDFKCLHKRPDDQDAFPHPLTNQDPVA